MSTFDLSTTLDAADLAPGTQQQVGPAGALYRPLPPSPTETSQHDFPSDGPLAFPDTQLNTIGRLTSMDTLYRSTSAAYDPSLSTMSSSDGLPSLEPTVSQPPQEVDRAWLAWLSHADLDALRADFRHLDTQNVGRISAVDWSRTMAEAGVKVSPSVALQAILAAKPDQAGMVDFIGYLRLRQMLDGAMGPAPPAGPPNTPSPSAASTQITPASDPKPAPPQERPGLPPLPSPAAVNLPRNDPEPAAKLPPIPPPLSQPDPARQSLNVVLCQQEFQSLDTDRDGKVSVEEWAKARSLSPNRAADILRQAGLPSNQPLTFSRFMQVVAYAGSPQSREAPHGAPANNPSMEPPVQASLPPADPEESPIPLDDERPHGNYVAMLAAQRRAAAPDSRRSSAAGLPPSLLFPVTTSHFSGTSDMVEQVGTWLPVSTNAPPPSPQTPNGPSGVWQRVANTDFEYCLVSGRPHNFLYVEGGVLVAVQVLPMLPPDVQCVCSFSPKLRSYTLIRRVRRR
eukprot:GGOE01062108.1.p1 GENE.GGOE01062108.1~~GGOE01062108.1.p1  ORF type:complete len:600 (+),score=117.73 GGOE01062108.1:269-1801(+)